MSMNEYDFQLFNPKSTKTAAKVPLVRIRKTAIVFNRQAYELMENPKYVLCYFDPNRKAFGFQPTDDEAHPSKLTITGSNGSERAQRSEKSISPKTLYKAFDINIDELINNESIKFIALEAKWDEQNKMLIADLRQFLASRNGGAFSPVVSGLDEATPTEGKTNTGEGGGNPKRSPGRPPKYA